MPITKTLNSILTPDMIAQGFTLSEESDDFIHLFYRGLPIASFTQHTTVAEIHQAVLKFQEGII